MPGAMTALVRSQTAPCVRCSARTEFVCWWHPQTPVCLECPCPGCGDREGWLGNWLFPALILGIILLSLVVADAIWQDAPRAAPARVVREGGFGG